VLSDWAPMTACAKRRPAWVDEHLLSDDGYVRRDRDPNACPGPRQLRAHEQQTCRETRAHDDCLRHRWLPRMLYVAVTVAGPALRLPTEMNVSQESPVNPSAKYHSAPPTSPPLSRVPGGQPYRSELLCHSAVGGDADGKCLVHAHAGCARLIRIIVPGEGEPGLRRNRCRPRDRGAIVR